MFNSAYEQAQDLSGPELIQKFREAGVDEYLIRIVESSSSIVMGRALFVYISEEAKRV